MNTVLLKKLLKKEVANIVRKEHFPVQNMDQHCNDVVQLALIIIRKPKGDMQQSNQMTSVSSDKSQWTDLLASGKSSTPLWQSTVDPKFYSLDRGETYYNVDQEHAQQALKNVAMSLKRYDPVVLEKKAKQEAIVRRPPVPPKKEQTIRKPETLYRGTVAEADKNGNPKDNEEEPMKKPDTNPPTPPAQPGDDREKQDIPRQHVTPPPPTDVPPNEKPKEPEKPEKPDPEQVPAKEVPEEPETPEKPEEPEETPPEGEEEVPAEEKAIGKDEAKSIIKLLMRFQGQKIPDPSVKRLGKEIGIDPEKITAFIYGLALKYVKLHVVKTKEPKQQMQEQWRGANTTMPVQIVGVVQQGDKYNITKDGSGMVVFPNLSAAQRVFPDLSDVSNTKNFTWAMRGEINGKPAIRFETWAANDVYSR